MPEGNLPLDKFRTHPTNKEWDLYDVCDARDPRPPKGVSLLLINRGGTLIMGHYTSDIRYWGFKPGIPKEPIPEEFVIFMVKP